MNDSTLDVPVSTVNLFGYTMAATQSHLPNVRFGNCASNVQGQMTANVCWASRFL